MIFADFARKVLDKQILAKIFDRLSELLALASRSEQELFVQIAEGVRTCSKKTKRKQIPIARIWIWDATHCVMFHGDGDSCYCEKCAGLEVQKSVFVVYFQAGSQIGSCCNAVYELLKIGGSKKIEKSKRNVQYKSGKQTCSTFPQENHFESSKRSDFCSVQLTEMAGCRWSYATEGHEGLSSLRSLGLVHQASPQITIN